MASSGMQPSYFQGDPDAPPARSAGAMLAIDDMPPSAPRLRHDLVLWMVALRRITVLAGLSVAILEKLVLPDELALIDRKSTRLNSSHSQISYAVFCLKKKKQQ